MESLLDFSASGGKSIAKVVTLLEALVRHHAKLPCVCIMGIHQKGKLRARRFHSMIHHHVEFRIIHVPFCGSGIPEN